MSYASENRRVLMLILIYLAVTFATINLGYIDFGDGNYLYISGRMADGVRLYEEIVSPQPPVHLFIGKVLVQTARWISGFLPGAVREGFAVYFIRIYLAVLHAATIVVLWRIARRIFEESAIRVLAILLYVLLPNTYLWTRGFQSECHEILFLYLSFLFLLRGGRAGMLLAAGLSLVGIFTNMTFAPYLLLFLVYCLVVRPNRWVLFVLPTAALVPVFLIAMQKWSHGTYIQNVFLNQFGTYPPLFPSGTDKALGIPPLIGYAWGKLLSEGGDLLRVEGATIVLGFLGMFLLTGAQSERPNRGFILWFSLFAFGSVIFVTKGGTMEYIFTLGEPMVALLGAYFLYTVVVGVDLDIRPERWRIERGIYVGKLIAILFAAIVFLYQPLTHVARTLFTQDTYEAPVAQTLGVRDLILEYAPNQEDLILAPAYYAFLSDRVLVGECSSSCMWSMRYQNARRKTDRGPDVGLNAQISLMVSQLNSGKVKIVLLRTDQLGAISEIRKAVEDSFEPLIVDHPVHGRNWRVEIQTSNEHLEVYVPKQRAG